MKQRPNILFLMTDQHRWDGLGLANPSVKTPHLDGLARRGVYFPQAVCQSPSCIPSRYSITLGLYPFQTGVRSNNQCINRDEDLPVPTVFERFRQAGYMTIGSGKTHWYMHQHGPEGRIYQPPSHSTRGFDHRFLSRQQESCERETGAVFHSESDAEAADWIIDYEMKVGPNSGGESFEGYIGQTSPFPAERLREAWLADRVIETIRQHGKGDKADQPWMAYLSFDLPHAPLVPPAEFEALYSLEDIPDVDLPPPAVQFQRHYNMWHSDAVVEEWLKLDELERRRIWLRYYASISFCDAQFGRVFEAIREQGEEDNTVVVFCSDHGDSLGERYRFSKYSLYEGSVRVPLILAGAGVPADRRGTTDQRHAELVDIVPTLLEAALGQRPGELPGESLLSPSQRAGGYSEFHSHGYEPVQYAPALMWRTREWKLILFENGNLDQARANPDRWQGELYHLATDPLEASNLFDDPEYQATRLRLTEQLLRNVALNAAVFPRYDSYARAHGDSA